MFWHFYFHKLFETFKVTEFDADTYIYIYIYIYIYTHTHRCSSSVFYFFRERWHMFLRQPIRCGDSNVSIEDCISSLTCFFTFPRYFKCMVNNKKNMKHLGKNLHVSSIKPDSYKDRRGVKIVLSRHTDVLFLPRRTFISKLFNLGAWWFYFHGLSSVVCHIRE